MKKSSASVLVFLPLLFATGSGSKTHPWEWAATFKLPVHKPYQWIFQRVKGKYADKTMTMALVTYTSFAQEPTADMLEVPIVLSYSKPQLLVFVAWQIIPSLVNILGMGWETFPFLYK